MPLLTLKPQSWRLQKLIALNGSSEPESALKAVMIISWMRHKIILMPRGALPTTSWEGVRLQQKKNAVPTHLKMRVVKLRRVIQ